MQERPHCVIVRFRTLIFTVSSSLMPLLALILLIITLTYLLGDYIVTAECASLERSHLRSETLPTSSRCTLPSSFAYDLLPLTFFSPLPFPPLLNLCPRDIWDNELNGTLPKELGKLASVEHLSAFPTFFHVLSPC